MRTHSLLRNARRTATTLPSSMREKWKFPWRKPRTVALSVSINRVMSPSDAVDLESPLHEVYQLLHFRIALFTYWHRQVASAASFPSHSVE